MARDIFHPIVREALEKEGWVITHDPYFVEAEERKHQIDLAAELLVAAERNQTKIAVEIKSFLSASVAYEFHTVLGQYLNYRPFVQIKEPDRKLYLAINQRVYKKFFTQKSTRFITQLYLVNIIVVNEVSKRIELWIESGENTDA